LLDWLAENAVRIAKAMNQTMRAKGGSDEFYHAADIERMVEVLTDE